MKAYELIPKNGQKSFYGKAIVYVNADGSETLYSYNTPIIERKANGELVRIWRGWSVTTGRHIKAFCGLNKAEFLRIETASIPPMAADMTPQESYKSMIARRNEK